MHVIATVAVIFCFVAYCVQANPAFSGNANVARSEEKTFDVIEGLVEFPKNETPEAWNKLLRTYEFLFVNFYADWCRFSQALEPNWRLTAHKVVNYYLNYSITPKFLRNSFLWRRFWKMKTAER